jgi:cell division protease FtsH
MPNGDMPPRPPAGGPPRQNSVMRNIIIAVIAFLAIAAVFTLFSNPLSGETNEVSFSTIVNKINEEKVEKLEVVKDQVIIKVIDEEKDLVALRETGISITEALNQSGVDPSKLEKVDITVRDTSGGDFFINTILPFLLPVLLFIGLIWFMVRSVQGGSNKAMSFGQSRARRSDGRDRKRRVTFKDVAGVKEAKQELREIVEFLKEPAKFAKLGAKIPHGVLLMGPPGTGKTLLARAVAGEANVPFYHISGSEFVEMFVGVGASRVRDLFKKAKREAPAIIFVDEIDAVGRQRGAGLGGSHDEREQTLNQILVEMDGFDTDTNVIVMAATNRPDVLDPALLRPGRFDRRVVLDEPDINDRESILKIHARKKPLASDVNLHQLAQRTPGFSGADLENVLNEAAILAARQGQKEVTMKDCREAIEKVMLGPERKSHILTPAEKKITAYHEAGHALVSHILPQADSVHKVSIVSRGHAAGYTMNLPDEDKHLHSQGEFEDELATLLAGYATEKRVFKDLTSGASNDLKRATKLARKLVVEYGMSDTIGPVSYANRDELIFLGKEFGDAREYSETMAAKIDTEVHSFIAKAYRRASQVLEENEAKLEAIAKALIEKETLEKEDFEKLVADSTTETKSE